MCEAQRGILVTHRRPSPHPLKPTKIDSKSIKKVNSKGQGRKRGLEQVRNVSKIWEDGKQKCEWELSFQGKELGSHNILLLLFYDKGTDEF